jgi:hypothetical protein
MVHYKASGENRKLFKGFLKEFFNLHPAQLQLPCSLSDLGIEDN